MGEGRITRDNIYYLWYNPCRHAMRTMHGAVGADFAVPAISIPNCGCVYSYKMFVRRAIACCGYERAAKKFAVVCP